MPAHADTTLPPSATVKSWTDACAARIDLAAQKSHWGPGARALSIPLLHEDGSPNPVRYVEYAVLEADLILRAGEDAEALPDQGWGVKRDPAATRPGDGPLMFRRYHGRFAMVSRFAFAQFRSALDECLKTGEMK
jgi:hypothetical protein